MFSFSMSMFWGAIVQQFLLCIQSVISVDNYEDFNRGKDIYNHRYMNGDIARERYI